MVSAAAASCDIVLPQGAQCPTPRQPEQAAPSSPARTPIHVSACTAMAEAAEGDPAFSMQINLSFEAAARAGAGVAQPASTLTPHFAAVENLLFEGGLACSGGQQQGLSPSPMPSPSPSPSSRPPPAISPLNPEVLLDALSLKVMESSRRNQSLVMSPHAEEWLVMHSAVNHSVASAPEPAADSESLPSRGNGAEGLAIETRIRSQALAPVTGAAAAVVVHADARGATAIGGAPPTLRGGQTLDVPGKTALTAPTQTPGAARGTGVGQAASGGAVGCAIVEPRAQAPVGPDPLPGREASPCTLGQREHAPDREGAGTNLRAPHADPVCGPCPAPESCTPCAPRSVGSRAEPASRPSPAEPSRGPCNAEQSLLIIECADPGPRHNPATLPPEPCSAAPRSRHAAASSLVREAHALLEPRAEDTACGAPLSLAPTQRASPWQPAERANLPAPESSAARVAAALKPTGRIGPWPPAAYAGSGSVRGSQVGQPRPTQQPPVASAQRTHGPGFAAGRGQVPAPWPRQEDFAIEALRARGGTAREGGAGGAAAAVPERVPRLKQPLAAHAEAKVVQPAAMQVSSRLPDPLLRPAQQRFGMK